METKASYDASEIFRSRLSLEPDINVTINRVRTLAAELSQIADACDRVQGLNRLARESFAERLASQGKDS